MKESTNKIAQLTILQALEQGYTLYGYKGPEYQTLYPLEDITPGEIKDERETGKIMLLAGKEPQYHTTTAGELMDAAIEDYYNEEGFSGDDTDEMDKIIRKETELFEEMAAKLNALYRKREFYFITKIELIP